MKNRDINKKFTAILAMTVIMAVVFPLKACAKEENPIGIITMTTRASKVAFYVAGTGDISIEWGDGKRSSMNDGLYNEISQWFWFSHDYSGITAHNIVITGNVTLLYCQHNQLTALDVSKSTAIIELRCSNNQLTSLDVSKNTALEELCCDQNQLTTLDVSKNNALESLECNWNQLTRLDVSKNNALTILSIIGNQFTVSTLNDLFRTLPDRIENVNEGGGGGTIYLSYRREGALAGNPGKVDCDHSIAQKKGWSFRSW